MRSTEALRIRWKRPKPFAAALPPIVRIEDGTFYKEHPETKTHGNPPLFPNLNFTVKARDSEEYWAIIGPAKSGKTTLLEILGGSYIPVPPLARVYPDQSRFQKRQLRASNPAHSIQYVGFGSRNTLLAGPSIKGAYLSARYESRREDVDFSLLDYLSGNMQLNAIEKPLLTLGRRLEHHKTMSRIIEQLDLAHLLKLPVSALSNGQTRRARIARAIISRPYLLLLDEPFLGLDPMTQRDLSPLLWSVSRRAGPRLVLTLKNTDEVPSWITHILYLDENHQIVGRGLKHAIASKLKLDGYKIRVGYTGPVFHLKESLDHAALVESKSEGPEAPKVEENGAQEPEDHVSSAQCESGLIGHAEDKDVELEVTGPGKSSSRIETKYKHSKWPGRWFNVDQIYKELDAMDESEKETLVEMKGIIVRYPIGDSNYRTVLGSGKRIIKGVPEYGLWWNICRGDRWGLFGPNGSGKTTALSIIASDHPQAYSVPLKLFGRSRLPSSSQPGISIFDLQARMGQASPEIHNYFPRRLTVRQCIENAWAETFNSPPSLTYEADNAVEAALRWFKRELDPSFNGPDPVDHITCKTAPADDKPRKRTRTTAVDYYMDIDLDWADSVKFGDLSFTAQRVALFIRAIIKKPDLVILDEAFSGMDEHTRIKCMLFLAHGERVWLHSKYRGVHTALRSLMPTYLKWYEKMTITGLEPRQALINVSHRQEEVPPIVSKWIFLNEPSARRRERFGTTPFREKFRWNQPDWWADIWTS